MLKERTEFIRNVLYLADLLAASLSFFIVYLFIFHFKKFYNLDIFPAMNVIRTPGTMDLYLRAYWLTLILWAFILRSRGQYQLRFQTYWKLIGNHFINGAIFFGFFASLAFLFKMDFLSRLFMVSYTVLSSVAMLFMRTLVLLAARTLRSRGYNFRNVLLVGSGSRALDFTKLLAKHKEWGYRIIGVLDQDEKRLGQELGGHKVMGLLKDLPLFLERQVVDEVVFVVPRSWLKEIEKSILYCEAVGVPATLATDFFDLEIASGVPREIDGFTYLTFETRQLRDPELLAKRTLDVFFSFAALLFMAPFFAVISAAVALDSKGPVFFKQVRCGRNGRKFVLFKFRSMVQNAEDRLEEIRGLNEMSGPVFKAAKDPRLTRIGGFLRKTSLDELPQFWNVLMGDMSLVGPRPPLPSEVEKYEPWQRRRLSMKPGITCIWQVSGRNNVGFEEWMKMDLQYIDRWSLWLDVKIIFQTVRVVLTGHGAK